MAGLPPVGHRLLLAAVSGGGLRRFWVLELELGGLRRSRPLEVGWAVKNTEEQTGARKPLGSGAASAMSLLLAACLLFSPSRLSGKPYPLWISPLVALAASWFGFVVRPCNPALPPRPFQLHSHQLLPYHLRQFGFRFQLEGTCVAWFILSCQADPEVATQPGMCCL